MTATLRHGGHLVPSLDIFIVYDISSWI